MKLFYALALVFCLPALAKDAKICTPEALGSFVGLDIVVAKIDGAGKLSPLGDTCVSRPYGELGSPMKIAGIGEKGRVETTVKYLQGRDCEKGVALCNRLPNDTGECVAENFPARIFFPEKPGQRLQKANEMGKAEEISEKAWTKIETIIRKKSGKECVCGLEVISRTPGKRTGRMVQKISVGSGHFAYVALVAYEGVVGVVPVSADGPQETGSFAGCIENGEKWETALPVKSVIAAKNGKYTLVRADDPLDHHLYSFNEAGKMISMLKLSTGNSECN